MGLDMYLEGRKYIWSNWEHPEKNIKEDGFKLTGKTLELGYWRYHPNLHGYIVNKFADGVDECQEIDLPLKSLEQLLKAVEADKLPATSGFFFGESSSEYKQMSIEIIEGAIKWLKTKEEGIARSVIYRASW
jgi:hypothetical protein